VDLEFFNFIKKNKYDSFITRKKRIFTMKKYLVTFLLLTSVFLNLENLENSQTEEEFYDEGPLNPSEFNLEEEEDLNLNLEDELDIETNFNENVFQEEVD